MGLVRCGNSSGLKIETSTAAFARKHICRATPPGYCRGSDLKERIYVAFRVLERSGLRKQDAYCTVADLAASHLGKSRRGRPTQGERDLFSKMKTVASMVRRFRQDTSDAENLVNFRIGQFLWLRRAGIVCGSQYVENSGEKMMKGWCDAVGAVPFKPIDWNDP
jgi:hypothetical protein